MTDKDALSNSHKDGRMLPQCYIQKKIGVESAASVKFVDNGYKQLIVLYHRFLFL